MENLIVIAVIAVIIGLAAGFLYKRLPIIASAQGTMLLIVVSVSFYVLTLRSLWTASST